MHAAPWITIALLSISLLASAAVLAGDGPDDPWLWLEEVEGEKALDWVEQRNAESQAALESGPLFEPLHAKLLEICLG